MKRRMINRPVITRCKIRQSTSDNCVIIRFKITVSIFIQEG